MIEKRNIDTTIEDVLEWFVPNSTRSLVQEFGEHWMKTIQNKTIQDIEILKKIIDMKIEKDSPMTPFDVGHNFAIEKILKLFEE